MRGGKPTTSSSSRRRHPTKDWYAGSRRHAASFDPVAPGLSRASTWARTEAEAVVEGDARAPTRDVHAVVRQRLDHARAGDGDGPVRRAGRVVVANADHDRLALGKAHAGVSVAHHNLRLAGRTRRARHRRHGEARRPRRPRRRRRWRGGTKSAYEDERARSSRGGEHPARRDAPTRMSARAGRFWLGRRLAWPRARSEARDEETDRAHRWCRRASGRRHLECSHARGPRSDRLRFFFQTGPSYD